MLSGEAESCPVEAELRSRIMARLGFDPFVPRAAAIVEVTVSRAAETFRGTVRAVGPDGSARGARQLDEPSCTELVDTMATMVSILLEPRDPPLAAPRAPDPDVRITTLEEETYGAQDESRTTVKGGGIQSHTDEGKTKGPLDSSTGLAFRVGGAVAASLGAAPRAVLGPVALIGIGTPSWSMDVEGRVDFPADAHSGGKGVRASLRLLYLVPCLHRSPVLVCPVAALGTLRGEGLDLETPLRDATFYAAFGLRAGVEAPLTSTLVLKAHAELLAPATQTTLKVDNQEVWTTPAVFAASGLGLVGLFP